MKQELDVLLQQLDELLGDPIVDVDDALEVTIVAGLAARLGAPREALEDVVAWREASSDLLDELWAQVDLEPLVEAVDACTGGGMEDDDVEEAVYDVDDVIAAAVWCGRIPVVRQAARDLARIIREVPDVFGPAAELAGKIAALPAVAENIGLYDYWLVLADLNSDPQ